MVVNTPEGASDLVVDLAPVRDGSTVAAERLLFDGFVTHPVQVASALLLLGRVARHRFYLPPGMVAAKIASSDPVVTTSVDRLRFESFSACCGMALRYDVHVDGLDQAPASHGTTNIDLTGPTRIALTGIRGTDPLHLRITDDSQSAVTFTTLDHIAAEARVPLPQRWIRGFAEAQAAGASLTPRVQITAAAARTFWRTLPRADNGTSVLHVAAGSRGLRLTGTATATTVPLGGPSRLRILEPLLRYATSVAVYGPRDSAGAGISLWQFDFPDGVLSCTLSPTAGRGFSGEGGLLHQLADPDSTRHAQPIAEYLTNRHDGQPLTPTQLARELDLTLNDVVSGLAHLAACGTVGYDAANRSYFHRELPWTTDGAEALNPRLLAAQRLLPNGTITGAPDDDTVDVRHGSSHHRVRGHGADATCTCPWIAQHGTSRGPCKHILAANLARKQRR